MYNLAVAQSGGPTAAINSSLSGVIYEAINNPQIENIYAFKNGIEGVINDNFVILNEKNINQKQLDILKLTPATALGSCRLKLSEDFNNINYKLITEEFIKHSIKAFIYIGGNDSMDTVLKLSNYIKEKNIDISIIGVPKTIDNDLLITDHTPGFGSAVKYLAVTLQEIIRDSEVYELKSVIIVEIMGRDAGWLTASSCILRTNGEYYPQLIYLPEKTFDINSFIEDINNQLKIYTHIVVAVSEGLKFSDGSYVASGLVINGVDNFGHTQLSGCGKILEAIVKKEIGCKVRSIELNVMQRCSSHIASLTDINEAFLIGQKGVVAAIERQNGKMMYFKRNKSKEYTVTIDSTDVCNVANKEKLFPEEFINVQGNNVTDDAIQYFLPLIQGEVIPPMKNGMPQHFKF